MAIREDVFNSIVALRPTRTDGRRLSRLRGTDNEENPLLNSNKEEFYSTEKGIQKEHKTDTKGTQKEHKTVHKRNTKPTQKEHKTVHNKEHKTDTKGTQKEHKLDINIGESNSITMLTGHQREILFFFYKGCLVARSKCTEPLTLEHIAKTLGIRIGGIKTTVQRLIKKGFIYKAHFKSGRSGWVKYGLPDSIYQEIVYLEMEHKTDTKGTQKEHKTDTQPYTKPDTSPLSSSSYINIETTTTAPSEQEQPYLSPEWRAINIEPLRGIGFSYTQLKQLQKVGAIPEVVQESIRHFAFNLENNPTKQYKTGPLNTLMGVLRERGAWFEKSYRSSQELAQEALLANRKAEMERRKELMAQAQKQAREEWEEQLTETQRKEILEFAKIELGYGMAPDSAKLGGYFTQRVWPEKKGEYLLPEFAE